MFIKLTILHVDKRFLPVVLNSDMIEKVKDINDLKRDEDEGARALGAKVVIREKGGGDMYGRESLDEIYQMLKGH